MLKITGGGTEACSAEGGRISPISPTACIYFVLSGRGICDNHRLTAGDGFFVPQNSFIQYEPDDDEPWVCAHFTLEGEDTEGLITEKDERDGSENRAEIFSLSDPSVTEMIKSLCPKGTYVSYGDMFDEAVAKILLCLPTQKKRDVSSPRSGKAHVDAAVKYINENYFNDIKVEQIASELGIDRKYLRNLFTQHMGMSTMDYIMTTRMNRAKELLADSDISVSLVARSVGYKDVLCFSKAFRNYTGMSPTDFRTGEPPQDRKATPAREAKKQTPKEEKKEAEQPAPKKKRDQMPVFYL